MTDAHSSADSPLVSIIINNYNYERFINRAIESALGQSYPQVEVIVVDDGSTDHSCEIAQGYGERIQLIRKENGGQASALNAGFAASCGQIVVFLDADDMLLPSMARDVVDIFMSQPETVRVQYRMAVIDENDCRIGVEKPERHIPVPSGYVHKHTLQFPFDMPWLPTSGNAFSTRALLPILPIPEDAYGSVGADWYLVHLTGLLGPVFFLDNIEACYRVHTTNHYERAKASLDLEHIRRTIFYSHLTGDYLLQAARKLGWVDRPDQILSVSYVANRLASLRLEPDKHPIPRDSRWGLVKLGASAVSRRFDITLPMKIAFLVWFGIMAVAPRPMAARLATLFFFPQERKRLNLLLSKNHHRSLPVDAALKLHEHRE